MSLRTTEQTLRLVRETLETARLGFRDLKAISARRHSGLRNLVVFGRAVTNVLQNLRSTESGFDAWYQPFVEEMKKDHLIKFFYDLRSRILKQGDLGVSNYTHIKSFSFPVDMAKFGPPPPNARNFFIGDSTGGTGWEVEVSPGEVEKYYLDLPSEIGVSGLYFRDAPGLAEKDQVSDADAIALSEHYIGYLERIVASAEAHFGAKANV
ncbi:MAG: hypothetical protein NUV82_00815 [Candidatus Komeilibacteria bacterium]|nr:hypothetical protein [Candidatus Komeilibacteria bacterium]